MLDQNAHVVLKLGKVSQELFAFKSFLSREILLNVASHCGACELRKIYKLIEATPTAIRLHIQSLEDDAYVLLRPHDTNRRCKIVCLTHKGWALMREYEQQLDLMLQDWITSPAPNI